MPVRARGTLVVKAALDNRLSVVPLQMARVLMPRLLRGSVQDGEAGGAAFVRVGGVLGAPWVEGAAGWRVERGGDVAG